LLRGFDEAPYDAFHFHESRGRDGPREFLREYCGVVKVDAYGVDDGVYLSCDGRIIARCCLPQARRKFDEAQSSHPRLAAEALGIFHQLYDIADHRVDCCWHCGRREICGVCILALRLAVTHFSGDS